MSSERDLFLFMADILEQMERYPDMIEEMKKAIKLNPVLSSEERNLLSVAYKNSIEKQRTAIRFLQEFISHEVKLGNKESVESLRKLKMKVVEEIESICSDFITLIDKELLPIEVSTEGKVFYMKLKGDYFRYMCEANNSKEIIDNTKMVYESAIEFSERELGRIHFLYLDLILNYTIFIYEILGEHQKAINLSLLTFNNVADLIRNDNDYDENISMIANLLRDNVALWTQCNND